MSISHPINSRRDMLTVFNARLQNTQSELLENNRLEFGRNMLKTAVIESNISPNEFAQSDVIDEVLEIEDSLWMVKAENNEGEGWLFVDFYDERLWSIYSLAESTLFNTAIDSLLKSEGGGLDRLWLPTGQVEEVGEMGEYEGIKISFAADEVFPQEFVEENFEFTDLSIDGSGTNSRYLYEILKSTNEIDDFISLSSIKIRREVDGEFVRERVTNEGSFTTRGGSDIQLHISTVDQIKERYEKLLAAVERNHVVGVEDREHGGRAHGSPVVIRFSNSVPDIKQFLSYVVNAQDPFRLWGHIREIGDEAYKVDGVDAHNGDKIAIEMSPEWLRLYLYGDACGNTALRLFTNIQHYYDPAAELVIDNV